ncbi:MULTISPECIES: HU family DNA-binding protein [Desulfolutivibrio]|jgi:DNA-binding protein HU-beta|uniref:HU family DNA-binding protein n=1 Tax=Desulfolutivibrio sulfodismutans TaxID=63561 RepID=A0A7K3NK55_9BACT|nr:HU family DNA-binding protein [Desulfolutivibrio sulfodismutans]NDY56183.1 HU family DNA-binding protein [Desulfolutivibrio sulfodismutans]QLA12384.1 DNA-binding protein [Desulfolutivibrio sulfodismutans DSM 3696]
MAKADLIEKVQVKAGFETKAAAGKALDAVVEVIRDALSAGETVTLTGFGSFKVSERAARTGRNPQTGKEIKIPASKAVKFTVGKALKEAVK